jgi:lactoylglutathione lyase
VPSLSLVVIRVSDLERSRRFYEALGLQLRHERHAGGPEHFSAELAGVTFEIYPRGNRAATIGTRIGFRVESLNETVAAVQQAGGAVLTQAENSDWGYRAVVSDPDGHRIELVELIRA